MATMGLSQRLQLLVDAAYAAKDPEDGMRRHLGASVIGEECMRKVWFGWHWADKEQLEGRMLRLFARGQKCEAVFQELLESVGAKVWTHDPATGNQFRISLYGGHYGGSMDGVATSIPGLPDYVKPTDPVLLEMKTHNDKSFTDLQKKGVELSKPKHYNQAQVYMRHSPWGQIPYCLYCAVNKNNDALYFEFFHLNEEKGAFLERKAEYTIFGTDLPPRISDSPSWWSCRFCEMQGVCHGALLPRINCRTCVHSQAQRDGTWKCLRGQSAITEDPKHGCAEHVYSPLFFPHWQVVEYSPDQTSITYITKKGTRVTNGVGGIPSASMEV